MSGAASRVASRTRTCRCIRLVFALVATLLVLSSGSPAGAQGVDHLKLGRTAAGKADWNKALLEYSEAEADKPTAEALEGMANALFHLRRYAEAHRAYENLLDDLRASPPVEGRTPQARAAAQRERTAMQGRASERIRILNGLTGTLAVVIRQPGALVAVDGQPVGASPTALVSRVDSGEHTIRATAGEAKVRAVEKVVTVTAGGTARAEIDLEIEPDAAKKPPPNAPSAPGSEAPAVAPKEQRGGEGNERWRLPHGSVTYEAQRTTTPPKIDGVLDDAIWRTAPRDGNFFSHRSKPHGQPTAEPTTVQVAYDEENLYVAFTCRYSSERERDRSFVVDEEQVQLDSESVGVFIDPLLDHTNALGFLVTPVGSRADIEFTKTGAIANPSWRSIWQVATKHSPDVWTAEFKIPLGALRMPSHDGQFQIGLNFWRREPSIGEHAFWSLHPPATRGIDTSYFGHVGLGPVDPGLRLYLQPYVAVAFEDTQTLFRSRLYDFAGTSDNNVRMYGGFYARYYPPGPFRLEATANPDFSTVTPDQAVANLDRFELSFPETRPFFAEDNARFDFGGVESQLFYSRRIGLQTDPATGATTPVPILHGTKAVFRSGRVEVSAMNVGLSSPRRDVSLEDNVFVTRANVYADKGARVGGMVLGSVGGSQDYVSGGVDGVVTFFDRHLSLSGLLARSDAQGPKNDSGMGEATLAWQSQDFTASATYLDVGRAFDARLGFFPLVGIRSQTFNASYRPVLRNDLVRQIVVDGTLSFAKDRGDRRIYDRGAAKAYATLNNEAQIALTVRPSIEEVSQPFRLAGRRILVPIGTYEQTFATISATTAPRRTIVGAVAYTAGDLFFGQRQAPSIDIDLNLGRFTAETLYELQLVRIANRNAAAPAGPPPEPVIDLTEHRVSMRLAYTYAPLARSTLIIEANSLSNRAVAQFVTQYTFGQLSTLSLAVTKSTGNAVVPPSDWFAFGDSAPLTAILSLAYGFSPF